ncbi:chromosome partition protein Smc [Dissulfurispira thermophila]|uniref:Chromosome partition protein Smc n=2 Tax=root TaxID=1 RepID=A0A7G1H6P0_9BACT|nr:chromosome segregation protein SMC [Dissulfurispira thermophila]BCB97427.1 chromosome partition protein Smc [Dissulfurispira thermophila]
MKIKQIELIGFKSFADRTLFPLHSGITCIVGPNGCGKSNIVDAFRWVLGEQSAKSLRGEKMEEVIFQGSATKKQKGMAEVILTLSQSRQSSLSNISSGNGSNEDAHDEIHVARRLYRSGESEYILNKKQCRLKDIRDIFLDTGLDVKSYSILDQGKIGEIINTRPLERRFLIEEVAGVMKYKVRKAEAISKLESSKQNLQRINDIIYEVKRQINSLDRQVKKAERYKRLVSELKDIELRTAKREHTRLSTILKELLSEIDKLKESDASQRSELSTLENLIEAKRLELAEREKVLSEIENTLHEKERSISDSEKRIAVLKANIENKKSDINRLAIQQEEIKNKKEELSVKISELNEAENTLMSNIENISIELSEKKDWITDIETEITNKESDIEHQRKELFSISEKLSNKKNEFHKLQSSLENMKYRESIALKDIETIKSGMNDLEILIKEAEESIKTKTYEYQQLKSEKDALSMQIVSLKEDIENKKILITQERQDIASNISRLNSLKELIVDKSLADFISEGHNKYRVLSDIISADKGYEIAIEAAISEKINALIIDNIEDAISVVDIIKEKNLGRTAILYRGQKTETTDNKGQTITSINHDNIIGKASNFATFEDNEVKEKVFGITDTTYIVKDLQTAIEILFTHSHICTFTHPVHLVTLDGEIITSDGWLFAGHGKDILKRKREIRELEQKIEGQQIRIKDMESDLESYNNNLISKKDSLKNIEDMVIKTEKQLSLIEHSLRNYREEMDRKHRKLSFLNTELTNILQEMGSLKDILISKTEEINTLEKEFNQVNDNITALQESLSSIKENYEDARTHLTELKLSMASYREKIDAIKKQKDAISDTLIEFENKKEQAIKEILDAEEKIKESTIELQRLEDEIKSTVIEVDNIQVERTKLKDTISSENQEIISKSNLLRNIRAQIDEISQQITDINSKIVENSIRIENIEISINQKYGVDIKTLAIETDEFDALEDENKINELNTKIRELGPVNLGTIEEYEELKNRYDFLTKQQQDLTMSIAELEEAISRINTTTRRKLREAYDLLRTKFSDVFTNLFGGGKADIILTDEDNILESGLDIIAQPPGKKLQNINLLSGGEKALTSLALLFAGFLIKPSPLCILDEVDAPLDESNTVRFAQMIKELSRETQFIVITHNRTTMEIADYLYGITMEEPGVSKAISLQFADVVNIN